jgi:beta-N-acetylglucosaminidase
MNYLKNLKPKFKSLFIFIVTLTVTLTVFATTVNCEDNEKMLDSDEATNTSITQISRETETVEVEEMTIKTEETTTVKESTETTSNISVKETTTKAVTTTEKVNDEPKNNIIEGDNNEKDERKSIKSIINSDIRTPSNYSVEELEEGLLYNLKPLASAYIQAEKDYGVNAVVLASISAEESGWGRHCYKPYNIFGFYTSKDFSSYEECIDYVARFLSEKYLTKGGSCFNGYTLADVNKCYNGSSSWLSNITGIAISIENRIQK